MARYPTKYHARISAQISSHGALFAVIFIAGTWLRFYGLSTESLWNDELASWSYSHKTHLNDVIQAVTSDVHPPGYQILLFFVERYIGISEFWLRFPSALAGSLSIPAIYLLGKTLFTKNEGLLAAALLAISLPAISYSQEVRSYSLVLLFSILSSYSFIHIFKQGIHASKNYSLIWTASYFTTACILSYLHYFGLLLVFCQGIIACLFLIHYKKNLHHWLAAGLIYLALFFAYTPWLPAFFDQLSGSTSWMKKPGIMQFLSFINFAFSYNLLFIGLPLIFTILLLFLFKKNKNNYRLSSSGGFLYLWFLLPLGLAFIKSYLSTPIASNKNLLIIMPAFLIGLARWILLLPYPRIKTIIASSVIAALFIQLFFITDYYSSIGKTQFREAAREVIRQRKNENTRLFVISCAYEADYFNYYFRQLQSSITVNINTCGNIQHHRLFDQIDTYRPDFIWLISGHRKFDPEFLRAFNNTYLLVEKKQLYEASTWLLRSRHVP